MAPISRSLAARLPRVHEWQEQQEAHNVLGAGLGDELGVATLDWGDGLWSVRCAAHPNHPPGNQLIGVEATHLDRLGPVLAWFDQVDCAVHLRLPGPALDGAPGPKLAALGFAAHELEAWMAAPLQGLRLDAAPHDIRPVTDRSGLDDFSAAFVAGWGIADPQVQRMARGAMCPWPGPAPWRRYVAYVDGQPAGEALLVLDGELAYLAEAATAPAFRRQGIQRALIARRAADARAAGATVLFGAVRYGDQSWANMQALGLGEAFLTVSFKRPARSAR